MHLVIFLMMCAAGDCWLLEHGATLQQVSHGCTVHRNWQHDVMIFHCADVNNQQTAQHVTKLNNCGLNAIKEDKNPTLWFTETTCVCQMMEEAGAAFASQDDHLKAQIIAGPPKKEHSQMLMKQKGKLKTASVHDLKKDIKKFCKRNHTGAEIGNKEGPVKNLALH